MLMGFPLLNFYNRQDCMKNSKSLKFRRTKMENGFVQVWKGKISLFFYLNITHKSKLTNGVKMVISFITKILWKFLNFTHLLLFQSAESANLWQILKTRKNWCFMWFSSIDTFTLHRKCTKSLLLTTSSGTRKAKSWGRIYKEQEPNLK